MKDRIIFLIVCGAAVGFAEFFGFSRDAGLFGAIIGGGLNIIYLIEESKNE